MWHTCIYVFIMIRDLWHVSQVMTNANNDIIVVIFLIWSDVKIK